MADSGQQLSSRIEPNVLTTETVTAGAVIQSNTTVKVKSKVLASKLNPVNCHKKPPKKVVAEKVRIDNLPESELQALLDEVIHYRGKKDGEKGTELFQALLRETQESGEESPPAFRPTQSTLNPAAQSAQQRRRRSRKESSGPFLSASTPPSVQSNSVAGSNRKGGSLQNISSSHSHSEWGGVRRRNRHDTSDSGSALGSPRKREGGSLPCDVARGTNRKKATDEHKSVVTGADSGSSAGIDCVINMEGVMEDRSGEDRFPESWNLRLDRSENSTSTTSGTIEPMEQDMELSPAEDYGQSKRLLSKTGCKDPTGSVYGTMPGIAFEEVDSAIPFGSLSSSQVEHNRISPMLNGMTGDEGHLFQRRSLQRRDVDENGNPFSGLTTINGPSSNPLMQTRNSSSMLSPINTTIVTHSSTATTTTTAAGPKATSRPKGKKKSKDGNVLVIEDLPGFVGNKDVDELLEYIESSEGNGGGSKKTAEKKSGPKHNGTLTKESATASSSTAQKVKPKGAEKKSSSTSTPTTKSVPRQSDSAYQPDSDDSESVASSGSPPGKADTYVFRTGSSAVTTDGLEEFEAAVAAAAAADFQTVTKRQKRKKRNSLSNSTAGSIKAKELLEQQSHMTQLFYNASSPSVMMRPPRNPNHQSGGGHGPGGMAVVGSSGGGGSGVGTGVGGDGIKKLVASVPPSEPSDMESDGDDSVHSLPVQPSAPLFPPPPLHQPPPPLYHAPPPFYNHNPISYADIIRSEHSSKSSATTDMAGVSFLSESTSLMMPSLAAVEMQQPPPIKCSTAHPAVAPVASAQAAVNVPSNRTTSAAATTKSTPSGVPLRRAASLPPTSPSVETPPVVIVGSSSSTQVDVTFGFELNEQLLALSMQPQPARPAQSRRPVVIEPMESSMLPEFGTTPEPTPTPPTPPSSVPSSPPEAASTPSPTSSAAVDFASRYRERPELLSPPDTRRSYEIVDFISQAWKRIERKLGEQHGLGTNAGQVNNSGGVLQQTGIRVYTLES